MLKNWRLNLLFLAGFVIGMLSAQASALAGDTSPTSLLYTGGLSATVGQPISLSATVTSTFNGTPTSGTITFKDGATVVGSGNVTGGAASASGSFTSAGSRTLTVSYNGNLIWSASSTTATIPVAKATSSTGLGASSGVPVLGTNVTLTASVTGFNPTGTVTFVDGATTIGSGTVSGGAATFSTSSLTSGAHSITAVYGGDTNNATSTSAAVTVTVGAGASTTLLSATSNSITSGGTVVFTATVSGASPTGFVSFTDGGIPIPMGSILLSNGVARAFSAPNALSVGTHVITARYSGDTNNAPSQSATIVVTVTASTYTSTTLSASSISPAIGTPVTFSAVIEGPSPRGTVTFKDGSTTIGTANVIVGNPVPDGMASFTTSSLSPGVHSITAIYSGDSANPASTSRAVTVTVGAGASTTSLSVGIVRTGAVAPSGDLVFGVNLRFTATITGASPTGTVTFLDGATVIGTGTVTSGVAMFDTASLSVGAHLITAVYGGDAGNTTSTSNPVSVLITGGNTTASLTTSLATPALGASVTFTATIAGTLPAGTVTFKDGATTIGTGTVSGGIATFSTSSLTAGAHTITAVYSGDPRNLSTTSPAITVTVGANRPVVRSSSTTVPYNGPGQPLDLSSLVDGDFNSIIITTPPQHGTAVVNGSGSSGSSSAASGRAAAGAAPTITYTPARGYSGTDSFAFAATGAGGTSAPATISISIAARPNPAADTDVNALVNAQVSSVRRFGQTQIDNVMTRLEQIHDEDVPAVSMGIAFSGADEGAYRNAFQGVGDPNQPTGLSYAERTKLSKDFDNSFGGTPKAQGAGRKDAPFAVWTGGAVSFGRDNLVGAASTRFTTGGVTAGVDTKLMDGLRAGFAVGFGTDQSRIGAFGTRDNAHNVSGSLYASYRFMPRTFLDAVLGYGKATLDSRRFDTNTGATLTGRRNANELYGSVALTHELKFDKLKLAPYARLDAIRVSLDAFDEQGSNIAALSYGKLNTTTWSTVLGVRGSYPIAMSWGVLTPMARLEYRHALDGNYTQNVTYADLANGQNYAFVGQASARDQFLIGLGARAAFAEWGSLDLEYQFSTSGSSGQSQSVKTRFKMTF